MRIRLLHEDNHLLVVEKPINVPTQADASGDPDLLSLLKQGVKERHSKPGAVYLGLVHRLDRPVGGVMVFARTSKAASRLAEQVRSRSFGKQYLAVARNVQSTGGTLEHWLMKDRERNIVRVVAAGTAGAKAARLHYEVMDRAGDQTLVRIALVTGRSHQIRVQFQAIGSPLYGDHKYGDARGTRRQLALWSHAIELEHPTLKEHLVFRSSPPATAPWTLFRSALPE